MDVVITIDTEEDNWANYSIANNPVKNIERIITLQKLLDRYRAKPTYLISFPVATNSRAVEILKGILDEGKCEIGMHCHPWNTPPFEEEITDFNSMLCNLPETLVLKKLTMLHETICDNFGHTPVSFRAGRWGFSSAVARALCHLGYHIDTSVSPFVDWGQYYGPDYSGFRLHPYRFDPNDIATPKDTGPLLEIPTTVGFLQSNFERCQRWTEYFESGIANQLHLKPIFGRLRMLNKVWLSPELADSKSMIQLAKRMEKMKFPCLNMSFHSSSLMAGLSPFVATKDDEVRFLKRIEDALVYVSDFPMNFVTLSQVEKSL
jgi:hypothetical protein